METPVKKRGRPRVNKVKEKSSKPEGLDEVLQDINEEAVHEYIPNGIPDVPDYLTVKNRKNINNNKDVPGIKNVNSDTKSEGELLEHACNICPKAFNTLPGLKRHITTSHKCKFQKNKTDNDKPKKEEEVNCNCCGENLAAHSSVNYKCFDCGNVFKLKCNIERHQLMVHCKDEVLNCLSCDFSCTNKKTLSEHLHFHAGTLKPYSCPVCFTPFSRKYQLVRHNFQTGCDGSEKQKFLCSLCDKGFDQKYNLREHLLAHIGQTKKKRTHNCEFCNKEFADSALLIVHRRSHLGENDFTCNTCGKSFNQRSRLTLHVRNVHKGAEPYMCTVCNKALLRKEDVKRHQIVHSGVKSHICPICKKQFAMKPSLNIHLLTHTKEPPQACYECGRAFIRQDCFLRHIRKKHKGMLAEIMADVEKKNQLLGTSKKDVDSQNDADTNGDDDDCIIVY